MRPLVIVDGANVVGSMPDGWWRDRLGAARRLRNALAPVAADGVAGVPGLEPPLEVVLVVEGAARPLADEEDGPDTVAVQAAAGSGDDAIVALLTGARPAGGDRTCVVITADRGLRDRVQDLGAVVAGPRVLPYPGRA